MTPKPSPKHPSMSPSAWAAFDQLARQRAVEDGDIVSKSGRDELIRFGIAVRTRGMGPRNLAITNLTEVGRHLAARYHPNAWGRA